MTGEKTALESQQSERAQITGTLIMMSNRHSGELEGDRAMARVVNLGTLEPMVTGTVLVAMSETRAETDMELAAPLSRHFLHSRRIIGAGEVRQAEDHCQLHVPSHWHDYLRA